MEREAQMRIDAEMKLEQAKIDLAREEAERAERLRMEELRIAKKAEENRNLETNLEGILPKVNEANMIAAELKREIRFNVRMVSTMPDFGDFKEAQREIKIKCDNKEDGYFYMWPTEKFVDRLEMMKEHVNEYFDTGNIPDYSDKSTDPFWDPPEPILIGNSYLKLQNLGLCIENDQKIKILNTAGAGNEAEQGTLEPACWPVTATGVQCDDDDYPEEYMIEEPEELLNKELYFRIDIKKATGLPNELCKDVFVVYKFKHEPDKEYRTNDCVGKFANPEFNYTKQHHIDLISEYHLDYFKTGHIVFKTYG
jgi:hypothetical protein